MEDVNELIKKINRRKIKLSKISEKLKSKFVGIDSIIDSIIENINVWYVIPELITRPVIINLWGMTGVGKTDLVRNLVYEMELTDKFVEIQMRNKANGYYNKTVQDFLNSSSIEMDGQGVLLLDEIQRYRTVDQAGIEIHDHDFQDLWMLLSDGVFANDSSAKECLTSMMFGDAYSEDIRMAAPEDDEEDEKPKKKKKKKTEKQKKRNFHRNYYSATHLKKKLKRSETVEEIMKWTSDKKTEILTEALKSRELYQGDSYSKLLIFVSGNLDEVYKMAENTDDAEIDADIFHEFSKKINVITVKAALRKRFKPEQISRFGNTHVIYPSLSKNNYKEIIRKKLEEITGNIYKRHGVKIIINENVNDFLYRNGVFPAQGVRPVLSTISSTIMNSIPLFLLSAIEQKEKEITIEYKNKYLISTIGNTTEKYLIEGEIDRIKENKSDEQKIITSVHEAGHSVAYANSFGLVPTQIVANGSSDNTAGYIGLHTMIPSKDVLEKKIIVLMAGLAAEEIVFGEMSKTAGSSSDIQMATVLASSYIREYGMNGYNSIIRSPHNVQNSSYNFDIKESNTKLENMLSKHKKKATELLARNKDFLIKIIDILKEKGTIKSKKFQKIAKEHKMDLEIMNPKKYFCEGYVERFENFKN